MNRRELIEANQARQAELRAEIAERRYQRELHGDPVEWETPTPPVRKQMRRDADAERQQMLRMSRARHEQRIAREQQYSEEIAKFEAVADAVGEHTGQMEKRLREEIASLRADVEALRADVKNYNVTKLGGRNAA